MAAQASTRQRRVVNVRESRVLAVFNRPIASGHRDLLRRYTRTHPVRGSLVGGVIWGTLMFLFFCGVTEFHDVLLTFRFMVGGAALFTAIVLPVNVRLHRKDRRLTRDA